MKKMKSYLFTGMLFISFSFYATTTKNMTPVKADPFSDEITRMLSGTSLIVEEDFKLKILFTLSRNKVIEIISISSPNRQVNEFLHLRLNEKQLKGGKWIPNKIYELPVRIKAVR